MSELFIHPSTVSGEISIPPSKSHSLRAILFAIMARGTTRIDNLLPSPDVDAMLSAVSLFGAKVQRENSSVTIEGRFHVPTDVIDAGNSGQILRFLGAISALLPGFTTITGDRSIRTQRPIKPLLGALRQLGAIAESVCGDGRAPISISGPIHSGTCYLSGEDSQPVSGLLIATSFLKGKTKIFVENPGETPWIDLTLDWIRRFGGNVTHTNYAHYIVEGGLSYSGFSYKVAGDFSSSAYPIAAALVTNSTLKIKGLDPNDVQGDKILIEILQKMGANIFWEQDTLNVLPSTLNGIEIDINQCIDALPILAMLGCFAKGQTKLYNGAIARQKESDRIRAMHLELTKMGAHIEELEAGLVIHQSELKGAKMHSYKDHRIALSLSIAALGATGSSSIEDTGCIAKSYPNFVNDFQNIGAQIEQLDLARV